MFVEDPGALVALLAVSSSCGLGSYIVVYPFSSEAYPTNIRGTALTMNAMFARVMGAVMPEVIYALYAIGPKVPIILFTIVSIITLINLFMTGFDRTGMALDEPAIKKDTLLNSFHDEYKEKENP